MRLNIILPNYFVYITIEYWTHMVIFSIYFPPNNEVSFRNNFSRLRSISKIYNINTLGMSMVFFWFLCILQHELKKSFISVTLLQLLSLNVNDICLGFEQKREFIKIVFSGKRFVFSSPRRWKRTWSLRLGGRNWKC